jgi:electron transfer flavoprotein alpha subunit
LSRNEGVLVLVERRDQALHRMSAELATAGLEIAEQLGEGLSALLVGTDLGDGAQRLSGLGVPMVYVVEDPLFSAYSPEPYLALLTELCREVRPRVVLMGHTDLGRDLAPRLAFALDTGYAANVVGVTVDPGSGLLEVTRPVFGGKAHGLFALGGAGPHILTVGQKVYEPAPAAADPRGDIVGFAHTADPAAFRTKVVERVDESAEGVRLEDASVIVSGGRGVESAEDFALLRELAGILGGCVGASRAAVDNGLVPSNLQIGLTGTVVSPNVYIAIGISGAAQHMAGCSSAKTIIAINRDPEAPIFQRAPFGVVADWREILPPLIEKCRSVPSS